jgi:hypothetical protein
MCAYIEAKSIFKDENEFLVLSLGTGEPTKPLLYTDIKEWGLASWAKPILEVVFDGVSNTTHQHLKTLLPENLYYRFQPGLDCKNESMDDASNENIRILKAHRKTQLRLSAVPLLVRRNTRKPQLLATGPI